MSIEVLDEHIIWQQGSFYHIKRWLRGVHPNLGIIVNGLTGLETVQEIKTIQPTAIFLSMSITESHTSLTLPSPLPLDQQPHTPPQSLPLHDAA